MKEPDRLKFGRALRDALGPVAAKWDEVAASDADQPLGRHRTDVSDAQRLALVSDPLQLQEFLRTSFGELFELSESIDRTLMSARS